MKITHIKRERKRWRSDSEREKVNEWNSSSKLIINWETDGERKRVTKMRKYFSSLLNGVCFLFVCMCVCVVELLCDK